MSRYVSPAGAEGQFEPGSRGRVLENLLNITSKVEMDRAELDALIEAQGAYYRKPRLERQRVTARFIRQMHRAWLGGVYAWAGAYRSVELMKGDFSWPPAFRVPENMARFEAEVLAEHTPCRTREVSALCRSLAIVHAELLLIHPFREGNGRLARWLADIMAFQAGSAPPEYRFTGRGARQLRGKYLEAVSEGYVGNYEPLERFFEEALLS